MLLSHNLSLGKPSSLLVTVLAYMATLISSDDSIENCQPGGRDAEQVKGKGPEKVKPGR